MLPRIFGYVQNAATGLGWLMLGILLINVLQQGALGLLAIGVVILLMGGVVTLSKSVWRWVGGFAR